MHATPTHFLRTVRHFSWLFSCLVVIGFAIGQEEADDPLATVVLPDDIVAVRGVEFARAGDPELVLLYDLIRLTGTEKADDPSPLLVFIHGGGWRGGVRESYYRRLFFNATEPLIRKGMAVATIDYRLAGKNGATTLDSVADCRTALRFLQAQAAELNLDLQRLAVMGGSAGGHLTLITSLAPEPLMSAPVDTAAASLPLPAVTACVPYYPLCHFGGVELHPQIMEGATYGTPRKFTPMLGGPALEKRELAEALSPITHLRPEMPSVLLLHGDADPVLPVASPRAFVARARQLKAPVTYIEVKGGNHGFRTADEPDVAEITRRVTQFLADQLGFDLAEPPRK